MEKYDHRKIEQKWQKLWQKEKLYKTSDDSAKPKYYVLDMFPYPSGAGLHVGHPKGYIATDIFARAKMLQGYNVLHPMGWDAFGLPAENYAIQNKVHPRLATEKNIQTFKKQLELLGFTYDWDREINTIDPEYYKWTQWVFLKMFEHGLAYESYEPINWCPGCQTGLSDEDLEDGKCERCGSVVEKKPMRQWMLKITDYADRMLNDLEKLPDWEESIREMQRNWIGRSEGSLISFALTRTNADSSGLTRTSSCHSRESGNPGERGRKVGVFTTRIDTIFGCTYLVLAPEHELVQELKPQIKNWREVEEYIKQAKNKTDLDRTAENKEKTGIKLEGVEAVNPFNNEAVPVFVADYVLVQYGTGAIMAVPAHDQRDLEFANKHNINVRPVFCHYIEFWDKKTEEEGVYLGSKKTRRTFNPEKEDAVITDKKLLLALKEQARDELFSKNRPNKLAITGEGWVFDSGEFSGLFTKYVRKKMTLWLEKNNLGRAQVNYKLRDWVFSRQRYWGEPIPIVHCQACAERKYNFIFIHGYTSSCQRGWKPWLKRELEKRGHKVFAPDLPNTEKPNVDEQVDFILKNAKISRDTIIIGHSLGGVVLLKMLGKIKVKIAQAIFLDSPIRPEFNDRTRLDVAAATDWKFNYKKTKQSADKFIVLADKNFPTIKREQIEELAGNLEASLIYVNPNNPHFSGKTNTTEPEILKIFENLGVAAVPEKELPLKLPEVKNYQPTGTGESPLANIKEWVNTKCPKCGGPAKRETNTMPQWAGSSWYYLRYIDPKNKKALVDKAKEKYWSPVDFYVGGAEHATRHLIYARFWHKFLYDIDAVNYDEPFKRLQHVGLILAEDGRKMSKRWHNVINPDEMVEKYGADAMRVYEMFMGPFNQPCAWSTNGLIGARRFLEKAWKLKEKVRSKKLEVRSENRKLEKLLHKTIKKVGEDIENFRFNTAISAMMIFINELEKEKQISLIPYSLFLILLSPFAPHLAEELWAELGNKQSIFKEKWPKYDPKLAKDETINLVLQVNGKVRDTVEANADIDEAEAKKLALGSEKIKKWLVGKKVVKVIFVKGRLVNIVIAN